MDRRATSCTRRFDLVSDDNGTPTQRTLMLAFDWRPDRNAIQPRRARAADIVGRFHGIRMLRL
jgi:hypothetical protein